MQACLDGIAEDYLKNLSTVVYIPATGEGRPSSDTFSFHDDGSHGTVRILSVLNGTGEADRLSSVRIRLNGAEIVAPNEITRNTDGYDKTMRVESGTSTLTIDNLSSTSGYITIVLVTETLVP